MFIYECVVDPTHERKVHGTEPQAAPRCCGKIMTRIWKTTWPRKPLRLAESFVNSISEDGHTGRKTRRGKR